MEELNGIRVPSRLEEIAESAVKSIFRRSTSDEATLIYMSDKSNQQDTPGRAKSSSSRQQTHPNQGTQTGSPEIDREGSKPDGKYRDRPADEGKHGDGDQTPNSGFP